MADLTVAVDDLELDADWTGAEPGVRNELAAALPVEGAAARWGDELYVSAPVDHEATDPRREVKPGTLAYWPAGPALCLFWGPTPASEGEGPRAASPVNVVARVSDVDPLSDLSGGATVRVERV